jgi:HTH-type transcriptional regulator/antitoxin HigA
VVRNQLWGSKRGTPAFDELDVLIDLVHAYEERRFPIRHMSVGDRLHYLLEVNQLTQSDLPEIGPQSTVSAILSGKRRLNLRMVKALAHRFHLPADVFIEA